MINGWEVVKNRKIEYRGRYSYGELFDLMVFHNGGLSLPTQEELKELWKSGEIEYEYDQCWDDDMLEMETTFRDYSYELYLWREI